MSYTYRRKIAFHETDAAGMVYFANFFNLAAEAEAHALDSLGILDKKREYFYPRVHVEADYMHPLFFNDLVEVETNIVSIGNSSIRWEYEIFRDGERCATVRVVSVRTARDHVPAPMSVTEKEALLPLMKRETMSEEKREESC